MTWTQSNLSSKETLRVLVHPHWVHLLSPGRILSYLLTLGLGLIWALWQRHTHELAVTDRRILLKAGVLFRQVKEFKLSSVESVEVDQSLLGRFLGYGTVRVNGNGEDAIIAVAVSDPWSVQKAAQ